MQNFEQKKREILDRIDLVEIVSEHVTLKRSGRRLVGLCPFHSEKTPSFTVTPDMGLYKCFGCGQGGDLFSFIQAKENVTFSEAMQILADRAGVELGKSSASSSSGPGRNDIARVNQWAMRIFRSNLQHETIGAEARTYLQKRNFSDSTLELFGVGLVTDQTSSLINTAKRAGITTELLLAADLIRQSDGSQLYETFRNRIMFPILDATRRVVGFGGRTLVDDKAKYLNTRQNALFDKGKNLYAVNVARDSIVAKKRAILVEGYTDCLSAHQAGFTETLATLGTALTTQQVDLLRRYCDEVILLFDSDRAGEDAADRAIRVALPRCVTCRLARIPDGKDPHEFLSRNEASAFSDVLNDAVDALEFKWKRTSARFSGEHSDAQRREAVLDFIQVVAEATHGDAIDVIQRGLLINQVAHLLRLTREDVGRLMSKMKPQRQENRITTEPATHQANATQRANEHTAWSRVLEVLLSSPDLSSTVDAWPDFDRIENKRDRHIAQSIIPLLKEDDSLSLADILAHFQDPMDVQRIEELARHGTQRGNYKATLQVALEQIHRADRDASLQSSMVKPSATDDHNENEQQKSINDGAKEHRHFVPRRMIRQMN